MKRKKYIKQLMSLGVQRNDAAGFVSACRVITAAGKRHLLPHIEQPPAPIFHTDYQVQKFAATVRISDGYDSMVMAKHADAYVHNRLAKELAHGLLDAGAIKITAQELPPRTWDNGRCVEYRATIKVAMEVGE